jgi:hypothetical protein
MSQREMLEFLKKNEGKQFTVKETADRLFWTFKKSNTALVKLAKGGDVRVVRVRNPETDKLMKYYSFDVKLKELDGVIADLNSYRKDPRLCDYNSDTVLLLMLNKKISGLQGCKDGNKK